MRKKPEPQVGRNQGISKSTRRDFLSAVMVVPALPGLPLRAPVPKEEEFRALLERILLRWPLPNALARLWLEQAGSQETIESLMDALWSDVGSLLGGVETLEEPLLLTALSQAIQRDFEEEGSVVKLDGWYLSQTECRLAALKSLLAPDLDSEHEAPEREFIEGFLIPVAGWGPRQIRRCDAFNVQEDGASALWLLAEEPIEGDLKAFLANTELSVRKQENRLEAILDSEEARRLTQRPGVHPFLLVSLESRVWQIVGNLEVLE